MATINSENFYRLVTLLIDGGSRVLRKRLSMFVEYSGFTLENYFLSNQRPILKLKANNVLHQQQMDKLFPPTGTHTDMEQFDLSLLCILLSDLCMVQPSENDKIEELRQIRNEIYGHTPQASINVNRFQDFWSKVVDIILDLAKRTGDRRFETDLRSFIEKTKSCPLDVASSVNVLKHWYNTELPVIKQQLNKTEGLQKAVSDISTDVDTLKVEQSQFKQILDRKMTTNFEKLRKADVVNQTASKRLKTEHRRIRKDVMKVQEELTNVRGKVETLKSQSSASGITENENLQEDLKQLKSKLIELYKKAFSKVHVSPMDEELKVPIDELYTKVVIVEEEKSGVGQKGMIKTIEKPVMSYRNIFFKENSRLQSIYLLASAGKGKTTWCYQVINKWCQAHGEATVEVIYSRTTESREQKMEAISNADLKGNTNIIMKSRSQNSNKNLIIDDNQVMSQFEFLFFIPLRHAYGKSSIVDAFCGTILEQYPEFRASVAMALEFCPDKVLIVCDGLDEYGSLLSRENLRGSTVLTTTRPWKYYDVVRSSKYPADIVLELKGLDREGIQRLTRQLLRCVYKEYSEDTLHECLQAISSALLSETVQIPLLLTYVVHLWCDKKELSPSITLNMIDLLICILEKGNNRLLNIKGIGHLENRWRKRALPRCMSDEVLQSRAGLLLSVAQMAFDGLKEGHLVFRGKSVLRNFKHFPQEELEACLQLGLLSKSETASVLRNDITLTFYHKLVQEFFTALRAATNENAFSELCSQCCTLGKLVDVRYIYIFLCGLDPRVGCKFSEHVAKLCSSEPKVLKWRSGDGIFCPDIIKDITNVQLTCVKESRHFGTDNKLHVSDAIIASEQYIYSLCSIENFLLSTVILGSLCLSNIQLSTSYEWQKLLQMLKNIENLQMVRLESISVADEKDVGSTVEQPATPSFHRESACTGLSMPVLAKTTETLSCLKISSVQLSKSSEWHNLMTFVSRSVCLKTLYIRSIKVREDTFEEPDIGADELHDSYTIESVTVESVEEIKCPLLVLLKCLVKTTTVIHKDASSNRCDGSTAKVLSPTGSLIFLRLKHVTMTKTEWSLLNQVVNESPSLQDIYMKNVSLNPGDFGSHCSRDAPFEERNVMETPIIQCSLQRVVIKAELTISCPVLPTILRRIVVASSAHSDDTDNTGSFAGKHACKIKHLELICIRITQPSWLPLVQLINGAPSLEILELLWLKFVDEHDEDREEKDAVEEDEVQKERTKYIEDAVDCNNDGESENDDAYQEDNNTDEKIELSKLKRVDVRCLGIQLTPLLQTLKLSPSVTYLSILLCEHEFTETLVDGIPYMKHLEKLILQYMDFKTNKLNLSNNVCLEIVELLSVNMCPEAWSHFFQSIRQLQNLKMLKLECANLADVPEDDVIIPEHMTVKYKHSFLYGGLNQRRVDLKYITYIEEFCIF